MEEIRLGTVGTGKIVREILNCVNETEGIRLAAVYSRKLETGFNLAKEFGTEVVYTNLSDLLSDPEVNTVYIASPNSLHYWQTKEALLSGKHVICEKPFCLKAEQVPELQKLADEKGLLLAEAVPTAFLPNLRIIQDAVSEVGRVRLVAANYSQYSSRYDRFLDGETPNVFNRIYGGGSLMDINYYNLYLTVLLFGEPKEADYFPNLHPNRIDTSGIALLRYPDFLASLIGAKDAGGDNSYQVEGEKGFIDVIGGSNGLKEVRIVTDSRNETLSLQPDPNRFSYEINELVRIFRHEEKDTLRENLNVTYKTLRLAELLRKKSGIVFPGD